jgi:hypothetical protein
VHQGAFPGIFDPHALLTTPTLRGFFVVTTSFEFPDHAGFLRFPFQQAQGKVYIVIFNLDIHDSVTSDADEVTALVLAGVSLGSP